MAKSDLGMIHYIIPLYESSGSGIVTTACNQRCSRAEASSLPGFVKGCPICEEAASDGPDLAYVLWERRRAGWPVTLTIKAHKIADVARWTRSIAEVREVVRRSATLKEAGSKLGVTKARVAALCLARGIDWKNEKGATASTMTPD